jgi:hypothetical protein
MLEAKAVMKMQYLEHVTCGAVGLRVEPLAP